MELMLIIMRLFHYLSYLSLKRTRYRGLAWFALIGVKVLSCCLIQYRVLVCLVDQVHNIKNEHFRKLVVRQRTSDLRGSMWTNIP